MAIREERILRPDPDPTLLTTEALRREIANLKDQVDTRLDLNDRAIELVRVATDRAVSDLSRLISANIESLSKVTEERFNSIATQFDERDRRTEQLSLADKTAIAAALQAQKEAAGATNESNSVALVKMENNFTKLIDQGQTLLQSVAKNMDDKINDLKSRLDTGEGQSQGKGDMWGYVVGAVGALIGIGTLITVIMRH